MRFVVVVLLLACLVSCGGGGGTPDENFDPTGIWVGTLDGVDIAWEIVALGGGYGLRMSLDSDETTIPLVFNGKNFTGTETLYSLEGYHRQDTTVVGTVDGDSMTGHSTRIETVIDGSHAGETETDEGDFTASRS